MKLSVLVKVIGIGIIVMLFGSRGLGGEYRGMSKTNKSLFEKLNKISNGETQIIKIPTYDGSGQVVHPDIFIKDNQFYLVITPHPYGDRAYENPSLFVSRDGMEFHPPKGLHNPVATAPKYGYNNDPDILFDAKTQMFYLYYLETRKYNYQYVMLQRSKDGIKWNKANSVEYFFGRADPFIVSPSVITKDKHYIMYYVEITKIPHKIRYIKSTDGIHWDQDKPYRIRIDTPFCFSPWHIDIFEHNGIYFMLINGYDGIFWNKQSLYLAVSENLVDWHFRKEPIISPSRSFYNSERIYRSTGLINNNHLFIWFSFKAYENSWHLGVKKISLEKLDRQ